MKKVLTIAVVMTALITLPVQASAVPYLTTPDSWGSYATFDNVGGNLVVTLFDMRNAVNNGQELTAIFFDLAGVGTLTPVSALINSSNASYAILGSPAPALFDGSNVGGEWAYAAGISGIPLVATRGISSTGLNVFGAGNFNGPNLGGPNNGAVDGPQWGLTYGTTLPNGIDDGLVHNSIVFTLSGAGSFVPSATSVTNVTLWYGTSWGTPQQVPEPTTLLLLGLGLVGVAGISRRLKK